MAAKRGLFEMAHEGTLFLDEIGDMQLGLQAKLLRALQEGEIEPVGSNQPARVDVRVIAATSRSLSEMVRAGTFRQDLYYRLNVLAVRLPPLRERDGDIGLLAGRFGERTALAFQMPLRRLTEAALAKLESHDWPGNVRELGNVIEQIYVRTEGSTIEAADVAEVLDLAEHPSRSNRPAVSAELAPGIARLEKSMIADALARTAGNKREAALLLGLSRSNLYAKMKRLGIEEGRA